MTKFRLMVMLLISALATGCVSMKPMSPNKSTKILDISKESVVLVTLDLYRPDGSRYIPHPTLIRVQKENAQGNEGLVVFYMDQDAGKPESELNNKFWFRLPMEPGEYKLRSIAGMANAFPFIGFFEIPLLLKFSVSKDSVVYIGHIETTLRPRQGDEFRAGPVIPLVDQGITGISGGTFDVTIKDESASEIANFVSLFPVLNGTQIKTSILPAWNRSKAQLFWENNGTEQGKTTEVITKASAL